MLHVQRFTPDCSGPQVLQHSLKSGDEHGPSTVSAGHATLSMMAEPPLASPPEPPEPPVPSGLLPPPPEHPGEPSPPSTQALNRTSQLRIDTRISVRSA